MTCIVGMVDGNVVLIGSDSAATDEFGNQEVQRDAKLFTLQVPVAGRPEGPKGPKASMLIGFSGSFLVAQAIRWMLNVPRYRPTEPIMKYMVAHFVPAARAAVTKALGEPKDTESMFREATFLIGFQGRLFTVESNGQIMESLHGYASVGAGSSTALGAMWASGSRDAWTVLEDGLHAAEYFCSTVRGPFHIEYAMK